MFHLLLRCVATTVGRARVPSVQRSPLLTYNQRYLYRLLLVVQVAFAPDVIDAASSPHGARRARSFERALRGAALGAATGFTATSGALAEYIDPDDVSRQLLRINFNANMPINHRLVSTVGPLL